MEDVNRGPGLLALYATETVFALVVLSLRLWARTVAGSRGWDDFFMVATWVLFAVTTAFVGVISGHGGFRLQDYHAAEQVEYVTELYWVSQPFTITALATGKIAVGLLIMRLSGGAYVWIKRGLLVLITVTSILALLNIVLTFAQCRTPAALWDSAIKEKTSCLDPMAQSDLSLFSQSVDAIADIVLGLLPIYFIKTISLSLHKRVGIAFLIGGGIVSGIFAIVKTQSLPQLAAGADLTWQTYGFYLWTGNELFVIIVCGSVPTLTPLWRRYICSNGFSRVARYHLPMVQRIKQKNDSAAVSLKHAHFLELGSFDGVSAELTVPNKIYTTTTTTTTNEVCDHQRDSGDAWVPVVPQDTGPRPRGIIIVTHEIEIHESEIGCAI